MVKTILGLEGKEKYTPNWWNESSKYSNKVTPDSPIESGDFCVYLAFDVQQAISEHYISKEEVLNWFYFHSDCLNDSCKKDFKKRLGLK